MIAIKCPKCQSPIEIGEHKTELEDRLAIFCSNKDCFFHDNPLIGIDRKEPGAYISESLV